MADDSVVDDDKSKIVTKFLLDTCRLLQPSRHSINAAALCARGSMEYAPYSDEAVLVPLSSGSVAEFYMKPMLSCVGDIDIMTHPSDFLAIPDGYPPPAQLPAEFFSRVRVFEIIDSGYPGYVYLMWSYLLTENINGDKYEAVQYEWGHYMSYEPLKDYETNGPAQTFTEEGNVSVDGVRSTRCLSWPTQAADWPTRHRNYDWPDSATVDHVVSNGCDVVCVAHPLCRQDEWMKKHQHRLSFSRAEIVLLNSWMPVQQIIYHMLRIFVKTERLTDITDDTGRKIFSNYNIKTLMLWACELKPISWWVEDLNVVRICVELLHTLAVWLTDSRCPHYFVNGCNLFDHPIISHSAEILENQLMSLTETELAEWFIKKYIRRCAQHRSGRLSPLFDDVTTSKRLHKAVSAVIDDFKARTSTDQLATYAAIQYRVGESVNYYSLTLASCLFWINSLSQFDQGLPVYFAALTLLHVARKTTKHPLTDEILDVLATTCLQVNDISLRRCLKARHSSVLSLSQAAKLMKVVVNNSRSTVQLIEIELSKAYLYRALRCKDSDSIYCLANVYLAVFYYTTGQYQTAINHCTLVMRSQDHSQCSSHVVQGELLPKIDDNIDTVLGLSVFYQYVRTAALNQQQQTQHVSVFTTELFAHYLHICTKWRHLNRTISATDVQRFQSYLGNGPPLFTSDMLLCRFTNGLKCARNNQRLMVASDQTEPLVSHQLDTSELVELLQQSAVEHLTIYRQFEAHSFGSVATIVTTDFEALYAYKRGNYQRCLHLSTQNVRKLVAGDRHGQSVVLAFPEFLSLMDDDIVSVTGLILIAVVCPTCGRDFSHVLITQLTLSLYLMTQCQLKLHHPATSLAQTLDYIEVARLKALYKYLTLDQLTLRLIERRIVKYLSVDI